MLKLLEVPLLLLASPIGLAAGAVAGYYLFPKHEVLGAVGGAVLVPMVAGVAAVALAPAALNG